MAGRKAGLFAIPGDAVLREHLSKQMDDEDTFQCPTQDEGQLAKAAMTENIVAAAGDGRMTEVDMVNLPPHYASFAIEPIRFAQENGLDFLQGNIIKYLTRWKLKNGLEDLAKAKRCLEMYIRFVQKNPDWWKREPVAQ